jgi:hypothetical protein
MQAVRAITVDSELMARKLDSTDNSLCRRDHVPLLVISVTAKAELPG